MSTNGAKQIQAGIFLLVGLFLFAISIFVIGREKNIFAEQISFHTIFSDVKGLAVGAPVKIAGVSVGRVSNIAFIKRQGITELDVTLDVGEEFTSQITTGSKAEIQTQGLLGDRFLNISPANSDQLILAGDVIQSSSGLDIAEVGADAGVLFDRVGRIAERLERVVERFESNQGIAHQLLFSNESGADFKSILASLAKLGAKIEKGDGLAHALVYGNGGTATVTSLQETANNLQKSTNQLAELIESMSTAPSVARALLIEPAKTDPKEMLKQIAQVVGDLQKISSALAEGKGTLGALLIDDSLYNNFLEITDGAKKSLILKQAIRASIATE